MKQYLLAIGLIFLLLVAGCASYGNGQQQSDAAGGAAPNQPGSPDAMVKNKTNESMAKKDSGTMMLKASYSDYDAAKYRQARAEGKVIYLEFYASWCPTCRSYEPRLQQAFEEMAGNSKYAEVVGFKVNYDTQEDLKREFGIVGQHTHVIIGKEGEVIVQSREIWSAQDLMENIKKAL